MSWKFEDDSPIYLQIVEQMKARIAARELKGGDRLPPVRELAIEAGVNPNTMQKALAEMERQGLLYTQRTAGRFVSEQVEYKKLRVEQARRFMQTFTENMESIGFEEQEIEALYHEWLQEKSGANKS